MIVCLLDFYKNLTSLSNLFMLRVGHLKQHEGCLIFFYELVHCGSLLPHEFIYIERGRRYTATKELLNLLHLFFFLGYLSFGRMVHSNL